VYWDWVTNKWTAWRENVLHVTDIQPDGPYAIRFTLTTTEAGATFDDVHPHVTVHPPYSFLPATVQHTLATPADYMCQVTMEYDWNMFADRQYSIQISWTEPELGSTSKLITGTVTAILKWDRTVTPPAWKVDTGDAPFPVALSLNNNSKIFELRFTRAGTVANGFTFVDVDPIAWAEQLMA
jgi:hypothetical protein